MADFNMTRLSSLLIDSTLNTDKTQAGCWVPSISTADIALISANLIANIPTSYAPILYNPTTVTYQIYNTRSVGWENLVSSPATATGVGLTSGSPVELPRGPRAAVEVAANQVTGFEYWDTTNNVPRMRVVGAWQTIQTA